MKEAVEETEISQEEEEEKPEIPREGEEEEPLELAFPPLPVNTWRSPLEIPTEKIGSGLNKKVGPIIRILKASFLRDRVLN